MLNAEFSYTILTLLTTFPNFKGYKFKSAVKWLKKHTYVADGQIVIPTVSQAISQPGSQLGDEHTKIREHYILSHSDAEAKFHGCEVPRLKCTGGHWLKICTRQPWTFFYPFFTSVLHHCISYLLSGKKYKYRHLKSCRLYEIHFGLSYWNEVQQQLVQPPSDLVPNWLFHIRRPCSLCSHRAGMLDSTAATKATIYQLWLHTFWSIAPLNC